jgi:hypothetical protein
MFKCVVVASGILLAASGCQKQGPESGEAASSNPTPAAANAATPSPESPATSTSGSQPRITISPETTFVTEPLYEDGSIDLVGAINAKYGEGVTPDQNAAVLLYHAIGPSPEGMRQPDAFFQRMGVSPLPDEGNYFADLGDWLQTSQGVGRSDPAIEQAFEELDRAMSEPWKPGEHQRIADWLKANEQPLELIEQAAQRPRYFSPVVLLTPELDAVAQPERGFSGQLLPGVQKARALARALTARAMLHLGEGKIEPAWQDLKTTRRLGRLIGQGPTMIEALVGYSIDAVANRGIVALLEQPGLKPETLERIEADLESSPPLPSIAEKIDFSERLTFVDSVLLTATGGPQAEEALAMLEADAAARIVQQPWFPAVNWDAALRTGHGWYDRMAAAMRVEDRAERAAALQAIEAELSQLQTKFRDPATMQRMTQGNPGEGAGAMLGEVLAALLLPAAGASQTAEDRATQHNDLLRIAIALAQFHAANNRYPQALDELTPRPLAEIPHDLFSGNPLHYQSQESGYLLYSVGPNAEDEEGRGHDAEPPGDDISIEVSMEP